MEGKKYWIVRSSGATELDKPGYRYFRKVGEHVIEADTGEIAVEIAERFKIGRFDNDNYIPEHWRLIGESAWGQVILRAKGIGGKVHYETESGEHKTRTEEEVMREIIND